MESRGEVVSLTSFTATGYGASYMALLPQSQAVNFNHLHPLPGVPCTHQDSVVPDGVEVKTRRIAIAPQDLTM